MHYNGINPNTDCAIGIMTKDESNEREIEEKRKQCTEFVTCKFFYHISTSSVFHRDPQFPRDPDNTCSPKPI